MCSASRPAALPSGNSCRYPLDGPTAGQSGMRKFLSPVGILTPVVQSLPKHVTDSANWRFILQFTTFPIYDSFQFVVILLSWDYESGCVSQWSVWLQDCSKSQQVLSIFTFRTRFCERRRLELVRGRSPGYGLKHLCNAEYWGKLHEYCNKGRISASRLRQGTSSTGRKIKLKKLKEQKKLKKRRVGGMKPSESAIQLSGFD